jgi:hypothetical protein
VCGAVHEGTRLDWAFDAPAYWNQARDAAEGFLNSDLCVIRRGDGESDHFIRGVIEIPIIDGEGEDEESFGIGAWVSLSEPNFKWYVDHPKADFQTLSRSTPRRSTSRPPSASAASDGDRAFRFNRPIIRSRWTSGTESRSPAPTTFQRNGITRTRSSSGSFANTRAGGRALSSDLVDV